MGPDDAVPTNAVHKGKILLTDFGRDEKSASDKATDLKRRKVSHVELKCSILFSRFVLITFNVFRRTSALRSRVRKERPEWCLMRTEAVSNARHVGESNFV